MAGRSRSRLVLQAGDARAGYRVDAHLHHSGRVLAFGGVEELAVHGDGAAGARQDGVVHVPDLRSGGAVLSLPIDPVADETAATLRSAALTVDAEHDAELVLVQPHDQRIL